MTLQKGPLITILYCFFLLIASINKSNGQGKIYTGYRLHLSGIKVLQQSETDAILSFTAVNTGKNSINSQEKELAEKLVLNCDLKSLNIAFLSDEGPLLSAILAKEFQLEPGAFLQLNNLQIVGPAKAIEAPTFRVPKKEKADTTSSIIESEAATKSKEGVQTEEKREEIEEEDIVLVAPKVNRTPIEELLGEKNSCPDLVFDTLKLIKRTDKSVWIEFTIKNIGKGPALLYDNESEERPFGIRAFISGTTFISKGAVTIGGHTIEDGLGNPQGLIQPGERIIRTEQFDIRKMTRYMPVLILSLDAFLKLRECDRTNNTGYIILE
jgi:NACalpha-BTF3-like transcription factor